jgi:hypothetical protein
MIGLHVEKDGHVAPGAPWFRRVPTDRRVSMVASVKGLAPNGLANRVRLYVERASCLEPCGEG